MQVSEYCEEEEKEEEEEAEEKGRKEKPYGTFIFSSTWTLFIF